MPIPCTSTTHPAEFGLSDPVMTLGSKVDEAQFASAFERLYPVTLRFLISRGAPADIAEEIAQAAWAKGWECIEQLMKPELIGAWVNSIAKNMLRNRSRVEKRWEQLPEVIRSKDAPSHTRLDVGKLLNACRKRDEDILRSYYLEGLTTEEIAREQGMTPVTVRVRLLRTRRALRLFAEGPAAVTPAITH